MVTLRRAALWLLLILLLTTFSILRNEFQIGNLFKNEFEIGGNNLLQHENNETKDYLPVKRWYHHATKSFFYMLERLERIHTQGDTQNSLLCQSHWLPLKPRKCVRKMKRIFSATGGGESALFPRSTWLDTVMSCHVTVKPSNHATWKKSNAFLFSVCNPINQSVDYSWYKNVARMVNYNMWRTNIPKEVWLQSQQQGTRWDIGRGIFQCFPEGIESLAQSLTVVAPLYIQSDVSVGNKRGKSFQWPRAFQVGCGMLILTTINSTMPKNLFDATRNTKSLPYGLNTCGKISGISMCSWEARMELTLIVVVVSKK